MSASKGFLVIFSASRYEGWSIEEFPTEEATLKFLNDCADNLDFQFRVFPLDWEVHFDAVEVVKAYRKRVRG